MLSPAPLRAGRETRLSEAGWGGGALAQTPLTGAGSAAAAALSAGALPEPGLACAASPRRWRRRLLCSNSGSNGRHGQVQRGAHPRAARYEAAVVSGTTPSGSLPDPVRSSPRYTPVPPAPHASGSKAAPCPCIPARGITVPEHPPLPPSPHPVRTYVSQSRPSRSSVTGAVPSRSLGLTLSDSGPPLGEASSVPSGESPFPRRAGPGQPCRVMGAAPGPDLLWPQHPPSSGPGAGTGSRAPLVPWPVGQRRESGKRAWTGAKTRSRVY